MFPRVSIRESLAVLDGLKGHQFGLDKDDDGEAFDLAMEALEWVLDGVVARNESADRLVEELVRLSDVVSERDEELIEVVLAAYRKEQDQ